jgi:acyl-CoA thioester hydrolase
MARPQAWRTDPASYPFSDRTETRFQDLDPLGHINNVAMAALFENGRVRFNRTLVHHKRDDQRWLLAALAINYLEEAYFPAPVTIASGIGHVGTRSWTILSAAFQDGKCVATCDTTLVVTGPPAARLISDEFRAALNAQAVNGA